MYGNWQRCTIVKLYGLVRKIMLALLHSLADCSATTCDKKTEISINIIRPNTVI
jgi:hypothetical protein